MWSSRGRGGRLAIENESLLSDKGRYQKWQMQAESAPNDYNPVATIYGFEAKDTSERTNRGCATTAAVKNLAETIFRRRNRHTELHVLTGEESANIGNAEARL